MGDELSSGLTKHIYNTLLKPKVHNKLAEEIYDRLRCLESIKDKLEVLEMATKLVKGYKL